MILFPRGSAIRGHEQHRLPGISLADLIAELQRTLSVGGSTHDDQIVASTFTAAASLLEFERGKNREAALLERVDPFFAAGRFAVDDQNALGPGLTWRLGRRRVGASRVLRWFV